jgi:hypothetical protein
MLTVRSCYQGRLVKDTAAWRDFACAVVICKVWRLAMVLKLLVVSNSVLKWSIIGISNPNPVCSHTYTWQYFNSVATQLTYFPVLLIKMHEPTFSVLLSSVAVGTTGRAMSSILWDVTPCSLLDFHWLFRGTNGFHIQGRWASHEGACRIAWLTIWT